MEISKTVYNTQQSRLDDCVEFVLQHKGYNYNSTIIKEIKKIYAEYERAYLYDEWGDNLPWNPIITTRYGIVDGTTGIIAELLFLIHGNAFVGNKSARLVMGDRKKQVQDKIDGELVLLSGYVCSVQVKTTVIYNNQIYPKHDWFEGIATRLALVDINKRIIIIGDKTNMQQLCNDKTTVSVPELLTIPKLYVGDV